MASDEPDDGRGELTGWLWVAFVAAASALLSRAFACAMPFAAVAALAALTLPRRQAVTLVLLAFLANQAIGFGLMHYPWTASTLAWGGAIGVAALAGLFVAQRLDRLAGHHSWVHWSLALAVAFAAYEAVLRAATTVLPSGPGAFAPAVVMRVFAINAAALGMLLAARRLAWAAGVRATGAAVRS